MAAMRRPGPVNRGRFFAPAALAAVVVTGLCSGPLEHPIPRRFLASDSVAPNLLLSTLSARIASPPLELQLRPPALRNGFTDPLAPNLLVTTLAVTVPASTVLCRAPVETGPRRNVLPSAIETNWLLGRASSVAVAPFVQTAEYHYSFPRRFARSSEVERSALLLSARPAGSEIAPTVGVRRLGVDDESPNLLLSTLAVTVSVPPLRPVDLQTRRLPRVQSEDTPNLLLGVLSVSPPVTGVVRGAIESLRARRPARAQDETNWLLGRVSTAPAALPFVSPADYFTRPPRLIRGQDDGFDWLTIESAPAPLMASDSSSPRAARIRAHELAPNLLLSTLTGQPAPRPFVQAFEYSGPPRRPIRAIEVERDWLLAVAPTIPAVPATQSEFQSTRRASIARADDAPNLLTSTLAGAAPAAAPFVQTSDYYFATPRRLIRGRDDALDWLTVETAPPLVPADPGSARAPRVRSHESTPNLLLSTFSIAPQSTTYPPFELPAARRALTRRFDDYPNLLLATFSIVSQSPSFPPFELVPARRTLVLRADDGANLLLTTLSVVAQATPFIPVLEPGAARRARFWALDEPNLLLGTFAIKPPPLLPFEWPVPKVRRPYAIEASLNLTLTTLALVHPVKLRGGHIAIGEHDPRITLGVQDRRIALKADGRRISISFNDRLIKPRTT